MKNDSAKPMDGMTRSAVLMMSLGEDAAAEVFKYLTAREVQQVGAAMASLKQVTRNDVAVVLEEFRQEADQFMAVTLGSDDYIRTVLTKALGSDRAAGLIEDILEAGEGGSGIDALNWLDPHTVAELIGDEHPRSSPPSWCTWSATAPPALALLTDRLRNDVMLRIATFGVQPAALSELTDVLNSVLAGQGKRSKMGGVRTAAEILNMMNSTEEETVVASLRERDADLAQKIIDEMFVFDNLLDVEDRAIQLILKEIDNDTLMVALKGAQEELRASSCATCPAAPPRCCARTWKRKARSACPRSRPSRRRSCRSPAAWPRAARSCWATPETTRMSDADTGSTTQLSRSAAWRRWQMLSFDEPPPVEAAPEPEPDPGPDPEVVLAQLRAQAVAEGREEGYAQGHAAGHDAGRAEGREAGFAEGREAGYAEGLALAREQGADEAARLHAMAESCAASIGALEERMGQSLLTLALDIAQQVIRNTLAEQPESVVHAVREVLHINPSAGGQMRLWANPQDIELIRLHLADELKEGHWRVLADESRARLPRRNALWRHRRHAADALASRGGLAGPQHFLGRTGPGDRGDAMSARPAVPVIDRWQTQLEIGSIRAASTEPWLVSGRITRATGLVLHATGLRLPVGAAARIEIARGHDHWADAEVVGFDGHTLYLMPQADISRRPAPAWCPANRPCSARFRCPARPS